MLIGRNSNAAPERRSHVDSCVIRHKLDLSNGESCRFVKMSARDDGGRKSNDPL